MTDLETENRFFLSAFCAVYFVFPSEHSFKDIFLILSHIQVTEELTVRHADNTDREEQVKQISCSFTLYNYSVDSIRRSISGDNTTRGIHNALKTHTKNSTISRHASLNGNASNHRTAYAAGLCFK